jgi:beta-glucosidase/6-phospho-beta-glucosidase/beta-galactosidase
LSPIFRSFLQAGFECSTHKLITGRRLDLVAATRHDEFVCQDYQRLLEFGIRTVREGIRWTKIESVAAMLDFGTVSPILEASHQHGIEIIWDLLHFGWPDHLDIFTRDWVDAFGELALRFAE